MYFPRLVVPVSVVISGLFKFLIQFGLFLIFFIYFFLKGSSVSLSIWALALPMLVLQMSLLGVGWAFSLRPDLKYHDIDT